MTDGEFKAGMDILRGRFTDREFPSIRVKLIHERLKGYDGSEFRRWCEQQAIYSKFAPSGDEFDAFIDQQENAKLQMTVEKAKGLETVSGKICLECQGHGVVLRRLVKGCNEYAFVCDCEIGQASHWAKPKKLSYENKTFSLPKLDDYNRVIVEQNKKARFHGIGKKNETRAEVTAD